MRTATYIHQHHLGSMATNHQTIHLKIWTSKPTRQIGSMCLWFRNNGSYCNSRLPTIENGSHDAARGAGARARHGMNAEGHADLEQQLLRPNIALGDPAISSMIFGALKNSEGFGDSFGKWTWQMRGRGRVFFLMYFLTSECSKPLRERNFVLSGFWMFLDEPIKT